ncbi:MAG: hypothetical protein V1895_01295 [Parcubacteria group bacterium]
MRNNPVSVNKKRTLYFVALLMFTLILLSLVDRSKKSVAAKSVPASANAGTAVPVPKKPEPVTASVDISHCPFDDGTTDVVVIVTVHGAESLSDKQYYAIVKEQIARAEKMTVVQPAGCTCEGSDITGSRDVLVPEAGHSQVIIGKLLHCRKTVRATTNMSAPVLGALLF